MPTNDDKQKLNEINPKILKEKLDVETRKRLNEYKAIQNLRHYNEIERNRRNSKA